MACGFRPSRWERHSGCGRGRLCLACYTFLDEEAKSSGHEPERSIILTFSQSFPSPPKERRKMVTRCPNACADGGLHIPATATEVPSTLPVLYPCAPSVFLYFCLPSLRISAHTRKARRVGVYGLPSPRTGLPRESQLTGRESESTALSFRNSQSCNVLSQAPPLGWG